ncbi:MAG: hypothetical protein ACKORK_07500, partial [Gemmatimonadota bacterium]
MSTRTPSGAARREEIQDRRERLAGVLRRRTEQERPIEVPQGAARELGRQRRARSAFLLEVQLDDGSR